MTCLGGVVRALTNSSVRIVPLDVFIKLLLREGLRVFQTKVPLVREDLFVVRGDVMLVAELGESKKLLDFECGTSRAAGEVVVGDTADTVLGVVVVEIHDGSDRGSETCLAIDVVDKRVANSSKERSNEAG